MAVLVRRVGYQRRKGVRGIRKSRRRLLCAGSSQSRSRCRPSPITHALTQARTRLLGIAREEEWSKEAKAETIRIAVPELVLIEKNRSLDDKL
jgi:hypothetical protein